jgi:hypothetical protein
MNKNTYLFILFILFIFVLFYIIYYFYKTNVSSIELFNNFETKIYLKQ